MSKEMDVIPSETIYSDGEVIIPMADVQHIEKRYYNTDMVNPSVKQGDLMGILIITCHTKWDMDADCCGLSHRGNRWGTGSRFLLCSYFFSYLCDAPRYRKSHQQISGRTSRTTSRHLRPPYKPHRLSCATSHCALSFSALFPVSLWSQFHIILYFSTPLFPLYHLLHI